MKRCITTTLFAVILFCAVGAWGAVDSTGCTTAEECSQTWVWATAGFLLGAWTTPNTANLQVDSGWVGFGDDGDPPDSARIIIYNNSSKTPSTLIAVSDTAVVTDENLCKMIKVQFAQESMPQNDSIWIAISIFGAVWNTRAGLSGSQGADIYYHLNYTTIDDPWDAGNDVYDGNWYKPSARIFLSVAGAAPELKGRRRRQIILEQ